jgi:choline dehydrogenase/5-(hydroxymethyl)furfural/furfural oxidase
MRGVTDWVVVGGGAAGCVVARRLADAGHRVTLVDAGAASPPAPMRGPSYFAALAEDGWTFPGPFLRGRGLGGSGAVNGMVATAGDLRQYRSWGWDDAAEALARVRVPREAPVRAELGPMDRALLAAAPDAAPVPLTRRNGQRVTAADAYLTAPPPDLRVVTDAPVAAVALDGRRAVGVTLAGGAEIDAAAVAVAAGAIGSPALLARSGVDAAGLGEGLRNHPAVPVTLTLADDVDVDLDGLVTGTLLRRGDIQVVPLNHLGPGRDRLAMLLVVLMTPTGLGRVRTVGGEPIVEIGLSGEDRTALDAGVALVRALLALPPLRRIVADVAVGEPPAGVFHATSTSAVGVVVDDGGAVLGYDGLYVVDASVFPDVPATNPYLPTLMLAERLAARLVAMS